MRGENDVLARVRRWQFSRIARRCEAPPTSDLQCEAVVVAPHYDDETLGAGGTILVRQSLGARTHLVFLTDGSTSHAAYVGRDELAAMRRGEGEDAATRLGIARDCVRYFEYPDGALARFADDAATRLATLLDETGATTVFAPWRNDGHADHDAAFEIATRAIARTGRAGEIWEYPVWAWDVWPWMACPRWTPLGRAMVRTHRRYWRRSAATARGLTSGRSFTHAVDIRAVISQKRHALAAHRSQLERQAPVWPVLADVGNGTFLPRFFNDSEVFRRSPAPSSFGARGNAQ